MDYFSPPPAPPLIPLWMTKSQRMREKEREKKRWGSSAADIIDLNLVNLLTDSVVFPQWLYHNNFTRARSPFFFSFSYSHSNFLPPPLHLSLSEKHFFHSDFCHIFESLDSFPLPPSFTSTFFVHTTFSSLLTPSGPTYVFITIILGSVIEDCCVISAVYDSFYLKKYFFLIQLALTNISSLFFPPFVYVLLFFLYYLVLSPGSLEVLIELL